MAKFTQEQIKKIIEERPAGVSVRNYCSVVGMHAWIFYYQRSRLAAKQNTGDQVNSRSSNVTRDDSDGFIPLKIRRNHLL